MFLVSTPWLVRKCLNKDLCWGVDTKQNEIYLTFDDGPNPQTTNFILESLDKYNAKATFFCLGKNIELHPVLYDSIIKNGNTVGNHTYSHLNGWKTHSQNYISDIEKADAIIKSPLFRPPYGRIKPSQIYRLKKKYKIIMWSVLSGDFDYNLSSEKCFQNSVRFIKPGSIVVFHDSIKASEKVKFVLPEFLKIMSDTGFSFETL
ncbi:MAG TPA: polysaccharide deacetylase family protein [Bacteroidales bacterium]|nr:polysaccharide deacetylase family protein [Bacteroidales bacterium]HPS17606.1 polysaccharide deacetylase family protein [Bacteroidales bacterium]